jgi:hypothetical protein
MTQQVLSFKWSIEKSWSKDHFSVIYVSNKKTLKDNTTASDFTNLYSNNQKKPPCLILFVTFPTSFKNKLHPS